MLGCPAGYPQLLLLYSRVNGRAVVSIQDTGFREYLSSARSRWSNIARHSREEGKKERKRGEKKETYHRVAIIARSSRPTYFCPIHRTIRRAEGERKRRGITFSRRTESHSLSPSNPHSSRKFSRGKVPPRTPFFLRRSVSPGIEGNGF